jgi:hypothetical protein
MPSVAIKSTNTVSRRTIVVNREIVPKKEKPQEASDITDFFEELYAGRRREERERDATRALVVIRLISPLQMQIIGRIVLDNEEPELVGTALSIEVAELVSDLQSGVNTFCAQACKVGREVPALCEVVRKARTMGY